VAADAAVTTVMGGRSRTKVMAAARTTVRRSRRQGRMRAGVQPLRRRGERWWAAASRRMPGVQTSSEWGGDAIGGRRFAAGLGESKSWTV
jgi:hypothetical protein